MNLQKLFPGYLGKSDEDFVYIWDESVIFFDANVLLSLYTYSDETFKEFEKVLTHNKFSKRIFITYQVGLEFSRNRGKRINHQLDAYTAIKRKITEANKEIDDWMKKEYRFHSTINIDMVSDEIKKAHTEIVKEIGNIDVKQMDARFRKIDEFIYNMIEDRITEKPNDKRMSEIFTLGKERYSKLIPPGFEDKKKSDDARLYGDLTNWLEIIRYIHKAGKRPVIFVTDDLKDDWWWREDGKTLGAHPLLIQEMLDNEIIYHQYTSEAFIKFGSEKIGANASADSLTELRTVASRSQYSDENYRFDGVARGELYSIELLSADN